VNRWLKHNSVSYPKIGKLICMSRGKIESIRRVVEWLKSIRVKGEFLGVALTKAGENILERSNDELDEIIDYLECNGVRRDWIGYVVSRCPLLLSYSLEEVRARVQFYLDMGMNEKDFGTMVFDYPRVLGQFTMEEMNEKVFDSLCALS
jgi:mTERF domain-containing protein